MTAFQTTRPFSRPRDNFDFLTSGKARDPELIQRGQALQRPGTLQAGNKKVVEGQGTQPNLFGQVASSLFRDIRAQETAASEQFGRNQAVINQFRGNLGGISGRLEGLADEQSQAISERASSLESLAGSQVSDVSRRGDDTLNELRRNLGRSEEGLERGIEEFARAGRRDLGKGAEIREASTIAAGIRSNADSQLRQIDSGLNPDGTIMTLSQRIAAKQSINDSVNRQVTTAVSGIQSNFRQFRQQFQTTLAGLKISQSQQISSGARTLAETGLGVGRQEIAAQQQGNQMLQFAEGIRQIGDSLQSAAQLNAIQFEQQGLTQLAALVSNNRPSVVSMFSGLASLFSLATAPGVQRLRGISSRTINTGLGAA